MVGRQAGRLVAVQETARLSVCDRKAKIKDLLDYDWIGLDFMVSGPHSALWGDFDIKAIGSVG